MHSESAKQAKAQICAPPPKLNTTFLYNETRSQKNDESQLILAI
jgi:hypothetical protein